GTRTTFDLPLKAEGTAFQQSIWKALQDIPHGQTTSYGKLGSAVGKPGSARAVGGAVGANPLPIVIPCHRVLASDRRITGYSGGEGIPTKEKLLDLEKISYR
ncbi:MAG TPA: methylated-DNA--[protein]-cysteine S-methyltransferase, partial [Pontimonas sp.]|nr:methylated-DNA--[protein]-cysteine S-methyltransferase [Pontimonas sp.]